MVNTFSAADNEAVIRQDPTIYSSKDDRTQKQVNVDIILLCFIHWTNFCPQE